MSTEIIKNNVNSQSGNPPAKQRSSNLELFRIITMLLIVAHHYVVNSGLTSGGSPIVSDPMSWRSIFLLLFGAFGKTGINCFVLITGYFMCTSNITAKKFAKLIFEVMFYKIVIYLIFLISGYADFSVISAIKAILPFPSVQQNFTGCFLLFYLCIPFLNIFIKNITEKQHVYLLVLLSFIYICFGTLKIFPVTMNYVSWYIVLYFIASYIRLYPKKIYENTKFWGVASLICVFLCMASVVSCVILGDMINRFIPFFFVTDSNTLLAVATGLSSFMFFKNVKMKNSKFINTVSASTFGVLLIHANSDTMRTWLWKDVLDNVGIYDSPWLIVHAIGSVIAIYIVCTCIDILRIKFIETPFFKLWDKKWDKIAQWYKNIEAKIFNKIITKN